MMIHQVHLCVENTRTRIYGAHPLILEEIDKVTSYLQNESMAGVDARRYNFADLENAWDGWVRFLDRSGEVPSIPSGLRDIVQHHLQQLGVQVYVQDYRIRPVAPASPFAPIPLWPHQEGCKDQMLGGGDVVARMPPRAGKTRTLLEVVRELNLPTLWIAPTNSIVTQTIKEAKKWFPEDQIKHVQKATWGQSKDALLTVCTAGGMLTLPPEFFSTRHHLVCDEVHHFLANKSWGRYLNEQTPHVFHRKGMTGTFFRSNGDDLSLLAFIGRVGYSISSNALLEKGFLVPTYTTFVPIDGPKVRPTSSDFLSEGGHGTLGIVQHGHRCDAVAACAKHLEALGRTVIILVATKHQGYLIKQRLDVLFPPKDQNKDFESVEFVSTDRPKQIIQKVYSSFVQRQEVRILIGTSMVGEGVDLPPADALIFASGGKAAVGYVQALYRVCTAHPGKEYGVVVDFVDKHDFPKHRLLEHSRDRWRIASSDPVFRMSHLSGLAEFPIWAAFAAVKKE
jgi:superfamily II DNA or RNA helicase